MKIKITADSTADLSKEILEKENISISSLNILLGEKEYLDGVNITPTNIFDHFNKTGQLPKTAALNSENYKEFFEKFLSDGYDAIVHFSISSDFSTSYSSAVSAASELKNVFVIDSRSLSTGIGLLTLYACDLVKENVEAEKIVEMVKERVPFVQASFVVDSLLFLHKGGRCSTIAYLGANLLGLKPSIEVKNGKMGVSKKYRGPLVKVAGNYAHDILEKYSNPSRRRVFITHSCSPQEVVDCIYKILVDSGKFDEILITTAGATVSSHCGKNTIGVLFINDGK
ncbi:MAG: DegV family protein [Clostridia bacterium]